MTSAKLLAGIDEPFLLASHASTSKHVPFQVGSSSISRRSKDRRRDDTQEDRLVVTVQGDGIHIFNVSEQTPLSSFTLGPSVLFSVPAVSRSSPSVLSSSIEEDMESMELDTARQSAKTRRVRRTYVGVSEALNMVEGDVSKTGLDVPKGALWMWTEEEKKDGTAAGTAVKEAKALDQQIMALVAPPSLPECVLAALDDGTVQAYDSVSMETLTSVDAPPRNPDQAYERIVLSHHDRASLPSTILEVLPDGATGVVSVIRFTNSSIPETKAATLADQGKKKKDKGKNRLSTAAPNVHAQGPTQASFDLLALSFPGEQDVEGELSALLTLVGRIDLPQLDVVDVAFDPSSFLTVLERDGTWSNYRVFPTQLALASTSVDSISSSTLRNLHLEPVRNVDLPISSSHHKKGGTPMADAGSACLLPLGGSFVLFATLASTFDHPAQDPGSQEKLLLLLWDVRFGTVIAAQEYPVPTSILPNPSDITESHRLSARLTLDRIGVHRVTVSLSVSSGSESVKTARSATIAASVAVPSKSSLANVVGKQDLTARYLKPQQSATTSYGGRTNPLEDTFHSERQRALLTASERERTRLLEQLRPVLNGTSSADVSKADRLFELWKESESQRQKELAELIEQENPGKGLGESSRPRVSKKVQELKGNRKARAKFGPGGASAANLTGLDKRRKWGDAEGTEKSPADAAAVNGVDPAIGSQKIGNKDSDLEGQPSVYHNSRRRTKAAEPPLPGPFVRELISLAFPEHALRDSGAENLLATSERKRVPFPANVVKYLMARGAVSNKAVHGGMIRRMLLADDWDILSLALRTLPDLTGDDLALVLKAAVSALDNPSQLEATLKSILSVVTTSGPLRLALRRHFTAQEILPIFEILDQWLHLAEDALTDDIPPLSAIIDFLQILLDAYFVTLLQNPQAHDLIKRLAGTLQAKLDAISEITSLQSVLVTYVKADEDERRRQKEMRMWQKGGYEGRQAIKRETRTPRRIAKEANVLVGKYRLESFDL